MNLNRRHFIAQSLVASGLALVPLSIGPLHAMRAPTDRRFVFIIQRGAADGLAIVEPRGDAALLGLRKGLMAADPLRLDGFFALHPALPKIHAMTQKGQAEIEHAVGTVYRQRSHFDAQAVLETGGATAQSLRTGWMNRLIGMLPRGAQSAMALSPIIPLALAGKNQVGNVGLENSAPVSDDMALQMSALYPVDPQLGPLWQQAMQTQNLLSSGKGDAKGGAAIGTAAADLLRPANGARLMMVETGGWDTHSAQQNRLTRQLTHLDAMVDALASGLGPLWGNTLVLIATEFGRTAALNGTQGTDHGTGSAAFWLGGSLGSKSQVLADWPGLSANALYQGRDLMPTRSFERMTAERLSAHFGLSPVQTLATLFPSV